MIELTELNPEQQRAVEHKDGPLLIIAGAGAGKTKTLTHRIANLVKAGISPPHILAITFTNKAAREMLERVGEILRRRPPNFPGSSGEFPWIGTFHGLGAAILREFPKEARVPKNFTILDEDDTLSLIRRALKSLGYDPKAVEPRRIREAISRAKGEGIDQTLYQEGAKGNTALLTARVWKLYEDALRESRALDFDDLLLKTIILLEHHDAVRQALTKRWTHIHVDEYQDTNEIQYRLIRLLTGKDFNLCVVGDSDQTIYTWRGANIENILHFEEDFPKCTIVTLEENYRSTQNILDAANQVIQKNLQRKPKNLFTTRGKGEPILLYEALSEIDEATYVVEKAQSLLREGAPPESIAVLYRTNFQSRVLEEKFLDAGIPYSIAGTRFFDRKEVRDALAYLRAAQNPGSLLDLDRASSTPSRGIGEKTLAAIHRGQTEILKGKTREKVELFLSILSEIRTRIEQVPPSQVVQETLTRSGLFALYKENDEIERLGNLSELVSLAQRYDTLPLGEGMSRFLTDVALASDQDGTDRRQGVRLMTVHAAKGLEFDMVFIVGLEEDLFPQRRMSAVHDPEREEEERRLFYVALTRAKKRVMLSHAAFRTIFGNREAHIPSSFLADIDDRLVSIDVASLTSKRERTIFFD